MATFLSTGDNPVFLVPCAGLAGPWFHRRCNSSDLSGFWLSTGNARHADSSSIRHESCRSWLNGSRQRFSLRRALVICQVALSLVLMAGALLFVRSLRNLMTLDAGFNRNGLLITQFDASRLNLSPERRGLLHRELLDRVRSTPGVQQAANVLIVPISRLRLNDSIEFLGKRADKTMSLVQSCQRWLLSHSGYSHHCGPRLR